MNKSLLSIKLSMLLVLFQLTSFAQWSKPVVISSHGMRVAMNENMGPCLAASGDTLHVIWSDHRTKGYAIYYTRSIDSGLTWTNPVNITDTNGHATDPSVAVCGRNIHIVWWDSIKGIPCSRYMHSTDGGNTWATKMIIDSNTVYWPGVAVAGSTVLVSIDKKPLSRTTVFLAKSVDNGNTWGAEQQISTPTGGTGRSEDQGTVTDGKYIHMCWNDNRNNPSVLEIYYRRSKDMGLTWDPEIQITNAASYSPMIFSDSNKVYVALGYSNPMNSWVSQSVDSGGTFAAAAQITTNITTDAEAYPSMVCKGKNLFMTTHTFPSYPWHTWVTQSADGGATWSKEVSLGKCTGTSFIALTCPAAHVVWPDSNVVYYSRNSNASPTCPVLPTSIAIVSDISTTAIYPNPVSNNATIVFAEDGNHTTEVFDITGRMLMHFDVTGKQYQFACNTLASGMYFVKIAYGKNTQVVKFIKG